MVVLGDAKDGAGLHSVTIGGIRDNEVSIPGAHSPLNGTGTGPHSS